MAEKPFEGTRRVGLRQVESFESLRDAWNLLLQKNPVQDAFLTWEWLYAWWKHYGKPRQLWLVTAWISNELVGVAPLMLEERRKYGLRMWDILELNEFMLDGPEIEQLISCFRNAGFAKHQKNNRHFYLPIQGDWQSYMGRLSQNLRGDLRRKVRRIERQGQLTFKHHSGREVTWQELAFSPRT